MKNYESKTNSLTPFGRYSENQGRSLHLGFVPTQIRMRQKTHLDDLYVTFGFFSKDVAKSRPLQNTVTNFQEF